MTDPKWITRQQVEFIHEAVIEMGGGARGLRDVVLLESALARPQNQHAYGETDTSQLGGELCLRNFSQLAFVDGNKRTAFYVAADFLEQNGHQQSRRTVSRNPQAKMAPRGRPL